MSRSRGPGVAIALLAGALAAAGCGLGPGADVGGVELTVTREFGSVPMLERTVADIRESGTVMRVLEGNADIATRYGGGFVQSIDGIEEAQHDGHPYDWFFYVDGIESPIGAADYALHGGERIWWDYHDWGATNRVPAVVGSWPAPFVTGYGGKHYPVAVECMGGEAACGEVRGRLKRAGVSVASGSSGGAIRVLVGPWVTVRKDPAAAQLEEGPQASGVFADFAWSSKRTRGSTVPAPHIARARNGGAFELWGLGEDGKPARVFGQGAGLVAATRRYEAPPTWVVTGLTAGGVRAAAGLLDTAGLRDHYAVATEAGEETPLPLRTP